MARRRKGASDSHFYYKWLDKALCDLQCARLLLTYGGDHYNIAFHCQQAIEKALKGYLLFRTGRMVTGQRFTAGSAGRRKAAVFPGPGCR